MNPSNVYRSLPNVERQSASKGTAQVYVLILPPLLSEQTDGELGLLLTSPGARRERNPSLESTTFHSRGSQSVWPAATAHSMLRTFPVSGSTRQQVTISRVQREVVPCSRTKAHTYATHLGQVCLLLQPWILLTR